MTTASTDGGSGDPLADDHGGAGDVPGVIGRDGRVAVVVDRDGGPCDGVEEKDRHDVVRRAVLDAWRQGEVHRERTSRRSSPRRRVRPATRRTAGDWACSPRNVPAAVMTPDVSHIPVMGIWPPYPGMSAHTASARNCESGPTRPSGAERPSQVEAAQRDGPEREPQVDLRRGPRERAAALGAQDWEREPGRRVGHDLPSGPGLAPTNHTTVESALVRTAPPIQS